METKDAGPKGENVEEVDVGWWVEVQLSLRGGGGCQTHRQNPQGLPWNEGQNHTTHLLSCSQGGCPGLGPGLPLFWKALAMFCLWEAEENAGMWVIFSPFPTLAPAKEEQLIDEKPCPESTSEGQVGHMREGHHSPIETVATQESVEPVPVGWPKKDTSSEATQAPQATQDFRSHLGG